MKQESIALADRSERSNHVLGAADLGRPAILIHNGGAGARYCILPTLRALCHAFGGQATAVWQVGDADRYYCDLSFQRVVEIEFAHLDYGWYFDALALTKQVADCDSIIAINTWHNDCVDVLLRKFRRKPTVGYGYQFSHRLMQPPEEHFVDFTFRGARRIDERLTPEEYAFSPSFGHCDSWIPRLLRNKNPQSRVLTVHPETWNGRARNWPIDRFETVIVDYLREFVDDVVIVLGFPGSKRFQGPMGSRVHWFHGSLHHACRLVAISDLFLGIDSAMLHVADLCKVPGVALFGPTPHKRWGFRFARGVHLQAADGSIMDISVKRVQRALREIRCRGPAPA